MDECDDPDCIDLEQLQEVQKYIDTYTDYAEYEKCCGGDHEAGEDCNGLTCCQDSEDSPEDCEECIDDCDECVEEHNAICGNEFDEIIDQGSPVKCDDDCMQCEEECEENGHDRQHCPQDHHTSWESCISTCGVCVDPTPLPILRPEAEFQLSDLNFHLPHTSLRPCDDSCTPPPDLEEPMDTSIQIPTQADFDMALDHWQTFQQAHHCAPDPCLMEHQFQPPQHVDPQYGFSFACDPTMPENQYDWQNHVLMPPTCNVQASSNLDLSGLAHDLNPFTPVNFSIPEQGTNPGQVLHDINNSNIKREIKLRNASPAPPVRHGKSCQWLMPCGSICGSTFAKTDDLKKHIKNSHLAVKGTVTCRWGQACTASFGSEAALTGHISKKHLAPLYAAGSVATDSRSPTATSENQVEELPWKCTFPGCSKTFQYKQVRDDHMASHTGSNRAHCPICHQWLNAEGSNFRRHMASHRPESEHMKCKHQHLGCRKTFARLDNLRRHTRTCKYGKKAAAAAEAKDQHSHAHHGHHHHHHHDHHSHVSTPSST